jgi:DNA-binding transcriptional LysR family regulator
MTLQQLRCLIAIADHGFSVSRAADALFTTQPGVSKMVRALEAETGAELFVRSGNRLLTTTDAGRKALALARRMLGDAGALGALGKSSQAGAVGKLTVGTTHMHARYVLLPAVKAFAARYPQVELSLIQGSPREILRWVQEGVIDIGLSTLPERVPAGIRTLEAYEIGRCIITPPGHPLLRKRRRTLEDIAAYPLITYEDTFNTGHVVDHEFQRRGLSPRIVLRATDSSVIKAYVAEGIGIAVIQRAAIDPKADTGLRFIDATALFPASMAMLSVRRDHLLQAFAFDFIASVVPHVPAHSIHRALGPLGN